MAVRPLMDSLWLGHFHFLPGTNFEVGGRSVTLAVGQALALSTKFAGGRAWEAQRRSEPSMSGGWEDTLMSSFSFNYRIYC